jgi:hypothetical protein
VDLDDTSDSYEEAGLERMITYSVRHDSYRKSSYYAMGFKSFRTLARWHRNSALVELEILRRRLLVGLHHTDTTTTTTTTTDTSSSSLLYYVDGATIQSMEYPSKESATESCKNDYFYYYGEDNDDDDDGENEDYDNGWKLKCAHGFDPYAWSVPKDLLKVQKSGIGENAGRGLFTTVDIPYGSYISLAVSAHPIRLHWTTTNLVSRFRYNNNQNGQEKKNDNTNYHSMSRTILHYYDAYGYVDEAWVSFDYRLLRVYHYYYYY